MTTDSENSDIDVCTVEDENCSHTGLTIVAAETYIESGATNPKGMFYLEIKKLLFCFLLLSSDTQTVISRTF